MRYWRWLNEPCMLHFKSMFVSKEWKRHVFLYNGTFYADFPHETDGITDIWIAPRWRAFLYNVFVEIGVNKITPAQPILYDHMLRMVE